MIKRNYFFLDNNTILFESNDGPKRLLLNENDYQVLMEYAKKYCIFDSKKLTKSLIDNLLQYEIILNCPAIIKNSFDTIKERTNLFFYNFDNKINPKVLEEKTILFVGAGGICSEIINQLLAVGINNVNVKCIFNGNSISSLHSSSSNI